MSGAGLSAGLRESLVPPGLPEEAAARAPPAQVEAPAAGQPPPGREAQFEAEVTIVPELSTNARGRAPAHGEIFVIL